MKRTLLTSLLLVLILSACGRTTRLNADVNALPFLDDETKFAEALVSSGLDLELPDAEGLDASEIGLPTQVLENLDGLELDFSSNLTLSSTNADLDAKFELFISDSAPIFDATPVSVETSLSPNTEQMLTFKLILNENENAELFELVKTGDFRLGARISTTGDGDAPGKISSEITKFNLIFTADLSTVLSF